MNDDMIRGILLEKKRTAKKRERAGMAITFLFYAACVAYMAYSVMMY